MKPINLAAINILLMLFCTFPAVAGELKVIDPWVRSAPPNAPTLGVFMTLENHTSTDQSVVAARTTLTVDRVELHRTMMVGDVMKMIPQVAIPVAPLSATVLKPGSWHVMLIGPEEVPVMGDKVQLTLVLDDGTEQSFEAVVRHGKMNHGQMKTKGHSHEMNME
jgi:copper(I)-binding protein